MHDIHGHHHPHDHEPRHRQRRASQTGTSHCHEPRGHHAGETVLVLRPYTGISGDIIVAGLARMLESSQADIDAHIASIGLKELDGALSIIPHVLNEVAGWRCRVTLPHEHSHRTFTDISAIIDASALTEKAKELANRTFAILAEAEGAVHGKDAADVAFHEVGALDSIMDVCLAAALFGVLSPGLFVCGPLPVCDGTAHCAHGKLPVPAPAVMRLLHGVPVRGIPTEGETITPTGLALLKAFDASFGPWPGMTIEREALVYGARVFENVPNGAIFACGKGV